MLLATLQLALVIFCAFGFTEYAKKTGIFIPVKISVLLIFSFLHIFPSFLFILTGFPFPAVTSLILLIGAIFGVANISKDKIHSASREISNSKWTCSALLLVILIRISTIPDDYSLVRGDMVSHIVPIIEWNDGKLGYPGVSYPRGFHGLFLALSFGLDFALVSNSVFILLMSIGWFLFAELVRRHLGDIESSFVLLLAGGGGIIGMPDGIIENTGWWLVRQSNMQPEISAWVFALAIMWLIDNRELIEQLDPKIASISIAIIILGAATTNPFFFLVCAPFIFCWSLLIYRFSFNELFPKSWIQKFLIISPILVLFSSTILMGLTEWKFSGSSADIHDASHRHSMLVEEFGVYFTEGLTLETMIVMLTPKPELTIGEISAGKLVKLVLLPSWFIIFAMLFTDFSRSRVTVYSVTVMSLYFLWYLGIPAPDGWSVIRTQYPHRAFSMLLMVYLIGGLKKTKNLPIFVGTLLWLSIEPEVFFDPIFRYEHSSRSIIACISFLIFYKLHSFLPNISLHPQSIKFWAPISAPLILLGFWCSFNLVKFPNPDLGVMFFAAILSIISGIYLRWPLNSSVFSISLISIILGALMGHLFDLIIGNYHQSSFILLSFLLAFVFFKALENEIFYKNLNNNCLKFIVLIMFINGFFHLIDSQYVTPLMIPGFPEII